MKYNPPMPQELPLREIDPPAAPPQRYAPQIPFPKYRFVPGLHAHPTSDEEGHSFGREEETIHVPDPEHWKQCPDYLFGTDLFNHAYWWEAHEAWEGAWKELHRIETQALFLQGLIQNSASMLKYHLGNVSGVRTLYALGTDKLQSVFDSGETADGVYMGLHLPTFLMQIDRCVRPLLDGKSPTEAPLTPERYPRIYLQFE